MRIKPLILIITVSLVLMGFLTIRDLASQIITKLPGGGEPDFSQDYLIGSALRLGYDPYLKLSELGKQIDPSKRFYDNYPYASPHPPLIAIIFSPFTYLDFEALRLVWFVITILSLAISVHFILKTCNLPKSFSLYSIIIFCSLLISESFKREAINGQINIFCFALISLGFYFYKQKKDIVSGPLLGLVFCLKLFSPWLLLNIISLKRIKIPLFFVVSLLVLSAPLALFSIASLQTWIKAISDSTALWAPSLSNLSLSAPISRFISDRQYRLNENSLIMMLNQAQEEAFQVQISLLSLMLGGFLTVVARKWILDPLLRFCAGVVVGVLCLPLLWSQQLIFLVLPISVLFSRKQLLSNLQLGVLSISSLSLLFFNFDNHSWSWIELKTLNTLWQEGASGVYQLTAKGQICFAIMPISIFLFRSIFNLFAKQSRQKRET